MGNHRVSVNPFIYILWVSKKEDNLKFVCVSSQDIKNPFMATLQELNSLCKKNKGVITNFKFEPSSVTQLPITFTQGAQENYLYLNEFNKVANYSKSIIYGKDTLGFYYIADIMYLMGRVPRVSIFRVSPYGVWMHVQGQTQKLVNASITKGKNLIIKGVGSQIPVILDFSNTLKESFISNTYNTGLTHKWDVHVVFNNDFSARGCLINSKDSIPIVEFYDMDRQGDEYPNGQFVASYYANSLLSSYREGRGLDLCADISAWKINADLFEKIWVWLYSTFESAKLPVKEWC